jgi:hypothetical protein
VDYEKAGNVLTGFVHASRMKMIETYPAVKKSSFNERQVMFSGSGIEVVVSMTPFVKSLHKLTFTRQDGGSYLHKIDGSYLMGTDGGLPKQEYKAFNIRIKGKNIPIPATAIKNLFEPNLDQTSVNYDAANDILYISALNGDGAGGYAVLFVIEKGRYRERANFYGF